MQFFQDIFTFREGIICHEVFPDSYCQHGNNNIRRGVGLICGFSRSHHSKFPVTASKNKENQSPPMPVIANQRKTIGWITIQ